MPFEDMAQAFKFLDELDIIVDLSVEINAIVIPDHGLVASLTQVQNA